jgi:hypothetical protein
MIETIPGLIDAFAGNILCYALVLAAVGTITMALLELLKSVFDARMRYNYWRINKWMRGEAARDQLEHLVTGSTGVPGASRGLTGFMMGEIRSSDVLYDQPAEKMMGQIQAAVTLLWRSPTAPEFEMGTAG